MFVYEKDAKAFDTYTTIFGDPYYTFVLDKKPYLIDITITDKIVQYQTNLTFGQVIDQFYYTPPSGVEIFKLNFPKMWFYHWFMIDHQL